LGSFRTQQEFIELNGAKMNSPVTDLQLAQANQFSNAIIEHDLVSVIIPNYNHAQYLSDAIQSVLNQTYHNFEIIVVDDGSTDNSREVIGRFGNQVRAIFQQNQGLSAARNTGIRVARGAYIGVLDADDMYEPNFMMILVSLLQNHPEADGIYCGYQFVDHLNNPLPQIEARSIPSDRLYQDLVDGNFLVPESMFVRRHCYETIGLFDESLRALEDVDMWLRITGQYKIIGTTHILTRHRILPGSMSTDPTRQFQNRLAVVKKHFGPEPLNDLAWTDAQRRAYGRAYLVSAVEYLQVHNETRAYECLCAMVNACPSLLAQLETLYELGCGDQPKGFRGHFASLNLEYNAQVLIRLLDKLFNDPQLTKLKNKRQAAYATAYYALGLLGYGKGHYQAARRFFLRAIRFEPKFIINQVLLVSLMKSLLGARAISWLKQKRQGLS
jgi:glycosyltransferase involved in cell wall biosynthesis